MAVLPATLSPPRVSNHLGMVRELLRRLVFFPLAGIVALMSAAAWGQAASFEITQNRTIVGTASYSVKATPSGFDSTSLVRVDMQGLNYSLSKTEALSPHSHLIHVLLSGIVNGSAVNIIGKPQAGQILLNISANGRSTTTQLAAHPGAVVLPDFDPGALETLLVLAAEQNNRDLWAVIPKQAGTIAPIQLATYADQQGTLDGKPVVVHHLIATIAGNETDLFSGPENRLLQAELPDEGFALVRKGFVLTPPAKPIAPPEQPGAPPQQQGAPPAAQPGSLPAE
jgi:hypothetical protein